MTPCQQCHPRPHHVHDDIVCVLHFQCAACSNAWYCGATCQKQHWRDHKRQCRQLVELIKSAGDSLHERFSKTGVLPGARPYYIGNAIAIDMLNLSANECRQHGQEPTMSSSSSVEDSEKIDYAILSGGCGNLRNWIHTVASLPQEFHGRLHTVLNDFDPFMQARNVLQLYMMTVFLHDEEIASRITTVWYSLHLPEKDYKFLVECLTALLDHTASSRVK